jgi:glycerate kinase
MKILLLPNSLKGSLSAGQTVRVLQHALSGKHLLKSFPLSDGGDGFIDFFAQKNPSSKQVSLYAQNAFEKTVRTSYLWLPEQKTAVIETARICGLGTAQKKDLDPLKASSFGVGQTILHAIKKGAKKIYIGLGGVACNDGGAGIAQALGARFSDKQGKEISRGAAPLLQLASLDITALKKNLHVIKIYAVADVTNPLLGPRGSARVYGPQKGATPLQVCTLEKALAHYARVVKKQTGKDIAHTPSTAAAGGLCGGLYGLCGAQIILGADFLRKNLPLTTWVKWADLVVTSEGKLDTQTLYGKAPLAVLQTAIAYRKPVLFICGQCEEKVFTKLPHRLKMCVVCLADFAKSEQDSKRYASRYIRKILNNL